MAQHPASPTASPTPARNSTGPTIADDFDQGQNMLVADVFWRWANTHMIRAEGRGLTQAAVAVACDLDESGFGKFLNRQRTITLGAWVKMQRGFSQLARRCPFEFTPFDMPDERSFAIAGWLYALNQEGIRQQVQQNRRPVGVLHYYCLRLMFANKDWHRAAGGEYTLPEIRKLVAKTLEVAQQETGRVPHVLENYATADRTYSIAMNHADLHQLMQLWNPPWHAVFTGMEGHNP